MTIVSHFSGQETNFWEWKIQKENYLLIISVLSVIIKRLSFQRRL